MNITVVDYQLGNISSIINMLKKIGVKAIYSNRSQDIEAADKLILPGVGAFDHGMKNLHSAGLVEVLNHEVLMKKKPILGICLGMQLLLKGSEEGKLQGLNWIPGHCIRFKFSEENRHLKVPHMGWNIVQSQGLPPSRFYFVHSYHAVCDHDEHVIGRANHGYEFPAIIKHDHIMGAQFHPEKSHRYGMAFLKNFIESASVC